MKKVIVDFIILFAAFLLINLTVRLVWAYYVPAHCNNHINNPLVTTLVVGSSESEVCINDSILSNCLNLSESALTLCANYNTLRWINEYTDQRIDTVFCTVGLSCLVHATSYNEVHDDPKFLYRSERYSLIEYSGFLRDYAFSIGGMKMLCEKVPYYDFEIKRLGGKYLYVDRNKIHTKEASENLKEYQRIYGKDGFTERVIRDESAREIKYLRKIADYCNENQMVFVIFNTPTYHLTDFISDRGYKDYLMHEFGPEQLIADYDNYQFPDDTYYGDYVHLNHRGAEYLCNDIKFNGWKLKTLAEYCR